MSTVSYSEVSSYLLCRRKWYYGYGMSLERNELSQSLGLGKALHTVLETYYTHIKAAGTTIEKQQAAHFRAVDMAMQAWDQYKPDPESLKQRADLGDSLMLYFQDEPFVMRGYLVLEVEREYVLEYDDDGGRYPFVVDLVLLDPWDEIAVVDHKTGYDFLADGDSEHLQPQLPLYIGGMRALKIPAAYGIYNQFRTRKIKAPMRSQLLNVLEVRPSDTRIMRTFREQVGLAYEVSARKALPIEVQETTAYRAANKMVCQTCGFKELCISDLQGTNSALVIETQFHPRVRRNFAIVSEENFA